MSTHIVSIAQKHGIPPFEDDGDFDQWLFELEMWCVVTDLPKAKQGPVLLLSLPAKVRKACVALSKEVINSEEGVDKLVEKLRGMYSVSKEQATFQAMEIFDNFSRAEDMGINDFINEFERLNQKLVNYNIILPPAVLAYRLLKNANLPQEKRNLARATIPDLTYESMKKQIKAIYDNCTTATKGNGEEKAIDIKTEDSYYGNWRSDFHHDGRPSYSRGSQGSRRSQGGGRGTGRNNSRARNSNGGNRGSQTNPIGPDGQVTKCHICNSIYHWASYCPTLGQRSRPAVDFQFLTKEGHQCYLEQVTAESLNCALVDTGCTSNVCGINWLNCFMDTLPEDVIVEESHSNKSFAFGPGPEYSSLKQINLPVNIGNANGFIRTDVVEADIPMLLSKSSLKEAQAQLDFVNDTLTLNGRAVQLCHTSSGHYGIPLSSKQEALSQSPEKDSCSTINVNLAIDEIINKSSEEKLAMARKLHKQFGHPINSDKIKKLLKDSDIADQGLFSAIDTVTDTCDICIKYRKAHSRPVVSFPLSNDFNECLALDLKFISINNTKYTILHMIDVFSRFSQSCIVPSKHKDVIVDRILKHWVAIFGAPLTLFSDNGGEFNNHLMRDVAELLGTKVLTTPAYSPWSNGIVERHNAIIENMLLKIIAESKCSMEVALVWATSAKNTLHNNQGFSPNQLTFGRNPNLPSVLTATQPALRTATTSQLIADHINALHAARAAFIKSESSRRIKTALLRKTRTTTIKSFSAGDHVYFKRPDQKEWHGPGVIAGIESNIAYVRHGGIFYRVSPCHLSKVGESTESGDTNGNDQNSSITREPPANIQNDCIVDIDLPPNLPHPASQNDSAVEIFIMNDDGPDWLGCIDDEILEVNTEVPEVAEFTDGVCENHTDTDYNIDTDAEIVDGTVDESSENDNYNIDTDAEIVDGTVDESSENDAVDGVPEETVNVEESSLETIISTPRVSDHVKFTDPDTHEVGEFLVISRGGKARGKYSNWFNVKNLHTSAISSVNFDVVSDCIRVKEEVFYNSMQSQEVALAQQCELSKWLEYNVYDEVTDSGQNAISTRWVITEKAEDNNKIIKARLVARGYEEESLSIRTDSPTVSRENLRLVSTIAVSHSWEINSMDVKSAFLQGFEIDREVYLVPPTEANTKNLWKLKRSVYGLQDASRSWYLKVVNELLSKGVNKSKFDNALFYYRQNDELQGVICSHVDDFLYGGSRLFHEKVIKHLKEQFSLSKESFSSFLYTGIDIEQRHDGIIMHQKEYIASIHPVLLENTDKQRPLNILEKRKLKTLVGQLQWTAKQTRPEVAFSTCQLSTSIKTATTDDVKLANKQLRKIQNEPQILFLPNMSDITKCSITVHADASFANLPGSGSQGGFVIFLVTPCDKSAPLAWSSHKLKRVVKSPMAAETMSVLEAVEYAICLKAVIIELYGCSSKEIPISCITDSKQLYQSAMSTKVIEDKRCYIDMCSIRDLLARKELHAIKWTSTKSQLADCLTKGTASPEDLIKVIAGKEFLSSA